MLCTKQETKTILTSRFAMLECGKNFKSSQEELCRECQAIDDEDHRLNHCIRFRDINHYDSAIKVDFKLIYSNDIGVLREIVPEILKTWNLRNANGTMNV